MQLPSLTAFLGAASRIGACFQAQIGGAQTRCTDAADKATVVARQEPEPTTVLGDKSGISCGDFSTASKNDVIDMLRLFNQGYAGAPNATCSAPPGICTRQACRNTSGIYLCNDTGETVTIDCGQMAAWLQDISDQCCISSVQLSKGLSGQQFSTAGWNVAVAYANCKHGVDEDRPSDFALWGPNGQCSLDRSSKEK